MTLTKRQKVEDYLESIHSQDSTLKAFITVMDTEARRDADLFDKKWQNGHQLSPAGGLVISIKDNIDVAGIPTTCGSSAEFHTLPKYDAEVSARLRNAGAILIGKVNLHEFAFGGTTQNPHHGLCKNPWDKTRIPGGSSGGSGVSVAARMCDASLGSDTGGSIRIPAALNGVNGLRPTVGRVSNRGSTPVRPRFDTIGPLGRDVATVAAVYEAIAGYDANIYYSGDTPVQELPYTTNVSKGQYTLAPDYGDTVASYLDKIKQEYYATWITGWMPTASGYYYQWLDVNAASTASTMTLYQSISTATTAGVAEELRPQRVIRSLNSYNEEAECTQVTVIGQDPNTGKFIPYTQIDSAAEIAATAPASRPRNWRGRPVCYQDRDPALNTLDAVTAACLMLYTRLTTGRTIIEFDATFLVYNVSNRPVWLGDVIKLMDTDGVGVLGNYRIIAIPQIEFVQENTVGSSTLFNVRRASYRAVYVSAGT